MRERERGQQGGGERKHTLVFPCHQQNGMKTFAYARFSPGVLRYVMISVVLQKYSWRGIKVSVKTLLTHSSWIISEYGKGCQMYWFTRGSPPKPGAHVPISLVGISCISSFFGSPPKSKSTNHDQKYVFCRQDFLFCTRFWNSNRSPWIIRPFFKKPNLHYSWTRCPKISSPSNLGALTHVLTHERTLRCLIFCVFLNDCPFTVEKFAWLLLHLRISQTKPCWSACRTRRPTQSSDQ